MEYLHNKYAKTNSNTIMKKIMIIDGGPRKNFNTASMLQKFAEGASSVSNEIEVKTVRLYDMDYKGCMSCMACKIKGKASNICKFKDALTPVLEEVAAADGLVMGSPIYFAEVTARLRAFLERLVFPWLSYNDYSVTAPKKMPVVLCYTMNANTEQAKLVYQSMGIIEQCLTTAMGGIEHVDAYNTYQVKNYERYELGGFSEEAKRQYRDENWEKDLQKAYDAGKRMAENIYLQL